MSPAEEFTKITSSYFSLGLTSRRESAIAVGQQLRGLVVRCCSNSRRSGQSRHVVTPPPLSSGGSAAARHRTAVLRCYSVQWLIPWRVQFTPNSVAASRAEDILR
ncbi:hypothetical protein AAHA92_02712 [Salvia divinorum]|uniref:Uncharacterized protein n=1 Tax=Salvia divinorum TaxID=28513 RepID=A0ABD1IHE8_SALDI